MLFLCRVYFRYRRYVWIHRRITCVSKKQNTQESAVLWIKVFRAVTTAPRKYVVVTTVVSAVASQLAILRPPLANFSHQLVS